MKPLAIVVSFDVGEQVVPGGIPGLVTSLVHEFGFDRAKAAFRRGIVPTISLPIMDWIIPAASRTLR